MLIFFFLFKRVFFFNLKLKLFFVRLFNLFCFLSKFNIFFFVVLFVWLVWSFNLEILVFKILIFLFWLELVFFGLFFSGLTGGVIGVFILGFWVSLFLHEVVIKGSELVKSIFFLINISFFLFIFCCFFICN